MQVAARLIARSNGFMATAASARSFSVIPLSRSGLKGTGFLSQSPALKTIRAQKTMASLMSHSKVGYSAFHTALKVANAEASTVVAENETPVAELKNFDEITGLNPLTQQAIEKIFQYKQMSKVQEAVLCQLPLEKDMFVKAKTGTGKTLAFLIPALESSFAGQSFREIKESVGTAILVVSPTRELAQQIAEEAKKLTKFYPLKVHCLVGGESKRKQIRDLDRGRADIIVGTPGRLIDMLRSVRHFKRSCESIKTLILDEADQLLDMGFKDEIQDILREIPEKRQTLLFSATLTPHIRQNIVQFALSKDHTLLDTVDPNEINTNLQVKQDYYIAPFGDQAAVINDIISNRASAQNGKTMVFLPTTRMTEMYAEIFRDLMGPKRANNVYELHSKKSQMQRTKISDRFRAARPGSVLFTSDISARGVDYPGVTLVLQIGVPSSREQYIHRLGRTGRAGKDGEGVIVLAPFEEPFIRNDVADLPLERKDATAALASSEDAREVIHEAAAKLAPNFIDDAYMSFLGYYSSRMPVLNQPRSDTLVHAKQFLHGFGVTEVPHMSPNLLAKMGLSSKSRDRNNNSRSRDRPRFERRDDRPRRPRFDDDDERPRRPKYDRDDERPPRRPRFNADGDRPPRRPRFDKDDDRSIRPRFDRDENRSRRPRFEQDKDFSISDKPRSKRTYRD
ncbi:hypothetical protein INT43_008814 [Umbelopsis isabellina]|uniref:ATP-dependent RNA helicase n=1 Tax=Mortierella isabellina TaxID=91625 RepID=A0A8H7PY12_MORIS|nr:hypothetical protein INT43_008814 [Umbelopsis isabellina]